MTMIPPNHGAADAPDADAGAAPDTRDRLIDRVASGDLTGQAWADFSRHAGDESTAWRTMAESLRDQLMLIDAAVAAADVADRVELPAPVTGDGRSTPVAPAPAPAPGRDRAAVTAPGHRAVAPPPRPDRAAHRPRALARARGAAGWMVSAMLLLALVTLSPMLRPPAGTGSSSPAPGDPAPRTAPPDTSASVLPANLTASDALSLYLARGRDEGVVIDEEPELVMVESRPAPGGAGYEVLYVRQILERAVVPELYVPSGRDAEGRPLLTRVARRDRSAF